MNQVSNIESHLRKLAILKNGTRQLNLENEQNKTEFKGNLHSIYTRSASCAITPQAFNTNLKGEILKYQKNTQNLNTTKLPLSSQIMQMEASFIEAGNFPTKALTKYLACVLNSQTELGWIPIRYLLSTGSLRSPQKEGYAVISREAFFNFPHIGDTVTLLNTPYYISANRYNIKYTEEENKDFTFYENVDEEAMNYIWQMSSYNFISVADTPQFNAFFNLNQTKSKPFLHLPLSREEQAVLENFDEHLPTYKSYVKPALSPNHPRAIATSVIEEIVNNRLERHYNLEKNIEIQR